MKKNEKKEGVYMDYLFQRKKVRTSVFNYKNNVFEKIKCDAETKWALIEAFFVFLVENTLKKFGGYDLANYQIQLLVNKIKDQLETSEITKRTYLFLYCLEIVLGKEGAAFFKGGSANKINLNKYVAKHSHFIQQNLTLTPILKDEKEREIVKNWIFQVLELAKILLPIAHGQWENFLDWGGEKKRVYYKFYNGSFWKISKKND